MYNSVQGKKQPLLPFLAAFAGLPGSQTNRLTPQEVRFWITPNPSRGFLLPIPLFPLLRESLLVVDLHRILPSMWCFSICQDSSTHIECHSGISVSEVASKKSHLFVQRLFRCRIGSRLGWSHFSDWRFHWLNMVAFSYERAHCLLKSWGGTWSMQGYDFFLQKIYQALSALAWLTRLTPEEISKQIA